MYGFANIANRARRHWVAGKDAVIAAAQANAPIWGVDCAEGGCGELGWAACRPIDWQAYAQGEYVGHARTPHVPEYRIRVDDVLQIVYRLTRDETSKPYELQVGDTIQVQSFTDEKLSHPTVVVQPDGTITLNLLGAVRATRQTIPELRDALEEKYKQFYKVPAISVTPVSINTKLQDLLNTVDARAGVGGQRIRVRVTPEGTIQLPALGSFCAQGLSIVELDHEIDERYRAVVEGVEATVILFERAPRYAYVLGEVGQPGRITLEGPTTVMMAIALAQGWNGMNANMRQVVVFRRGDDWRLMATMLDIQGALYGRRPCPADEIWLNDSDIVVVPKTPIRIANEFIEQVFTRGIYGVVPGWSGYRNQFQHEYFSLDVASQRPGLVGTLAFRTVPDRFFITRATLPAVACKLGGKAASFLEEFRVPLRPRHGVIQRPDERFMSHAIALATRGEGQVEPNPMVGSVVVRDGQIVGEGWHRQFGGPHAEVDALAAAGDRAQGATLYVSLEPCCHTGKTPPCTAAILQAGIRRVVVAVLDPFPEVAGKGADRCGRPGSTSMSESVTTDAQADSGSLPQTDHHRPSVGRGQVGHDARRENCHGMRRQPMDFERAVAGDRPLAARPGRCHSDRPADGHLGRSAPDRAATGTTSGNADRARFERIASARFGTRSNGERGATDRRGSGNSRPPSM